MDQDHPRVLPDIARARIEPTPRSASCSGAFFLRSLTAICPAACYNHPFARAMRAASTRLAAPSLLMASDR